MSFAIAQTQQPSVRLVPAQTLTSYPEGSFLESIVIAPSGAMYISRHETGEVIERSPNGTLSTFATNPNGVIAGLALDQDGSLYAVGGQKEQPQATVYRIAATGAIEPVMTIPGAQFLNGMTLLQPGIFLATDSTAGLVWRIDVRDRTATTWLQDESLTPQTPESSFPGANGIKVFQGAAYISNSDRRHIVRVPIQPDGTAGQPEIFASNTVIDDFAFAEDGTLYIATHPTNTVVALCPNGTRQVIAEAEQGVVGSTAIALGIESDRHHLYVVGNGGVFAPPEGGLQPAKLVQLKINEGGCGVGGNP
ncbi:MAG: SMP-30/gluconolactonase/LRE family protein [Oculatellaceae cyanobacterium Prado106]|nr:SMP-30/gluconolactonase/LRE family protein [Oculatellaceae cyanobacterium Prado106]